MSTASNMDLAMREVAARYVREGRVDPAVAEDAVRNAGEIVLYAVENLHRNGFYPSEITERFAEKVTGAEGYTARMRAELHVAALGAIPVRPTDA